MPATQPAQFEMAELVQWQVWNIDIEQPGIAANQLVIRHLQHQFTRFLRSGVQMRPILLDLGKGNRRHPKEITFHGRTHRAGVNRVVAHIRAVVDA